MSDIKKSNAVYISRCIALVCIVFAHSNIGSERILHALANSGVAIFFISSGIYYKPYSISDRLKRMKSLVCPWIFFGSGTYFLNAFITGSFKLSSWLLWSLGYNTYLWYLTIYSVSLLFFSLICIEKHKMIKWLCIFAMIVSRLICSAKGIAGPPAFLNPVNWMGFIALGMLISNNFKKLFYRKCAKCTVCISVVGVLVIGVIGYCLDEKTHYFGWTSVFSQFAWSYLILYASSRLGQIRGIVISEVANIGKNTLSIYLIHIALINWLCNRIGVSGILCIVISAFVVFFLYLVFAVAESFAKKNKKIYMIWRTLTGFSRRLST